MKWCGLVVHLAFLGGAIYGQCESLDPYFGKRHLIISPEFIYVKRAANISTKKSLVARQTIPPSCGCKTLQPSCPNTKMLPSQILAAQTHGTGLRLSLDYLLDKKATWQLRYTGLLHFKGEKEASCPGSLMFPFANGINQTYDYCYADSMKGSCNSYYWSGELNYNYHVTPQRVDYFSVSWIAGFRYVNLREYFHLTAYNSNCDGATSSSSYYIKTNNRMSGVQLGGFLEGNLGYNFTYGVSAIMGALVDFDQFNAVFKDVDNTVVLRRNNPSDFNLSFLGELAPYAYFNLSKSVLFKASYIVTYLNNVALAMNQVTFLENQPSNIMNQKRKEGAFMFHGVIIGLGFDF